MHTEHLRFGCAQVNRLSRLANPSSTLHTDCVATDIVSAGPQARIQISYRCSQHIVFFFLIYCFVVFELLNNSMIKPEMRVMPMCVFTQTTTVKCQKFFFFSFLYMRMCAGRGRLGVCDCFHSLLSATECSFRILNKKKARAFLTKFIMDYKY